MLYIAQDIAHRLLEIFDSEREVDVANYSKKTQIYVSEEQWSELVRESKLRGVSIAELIREAIDASFAYDESSTVMFDKALEKSASAWKTRKDIADGVNYVDDLRAGWKTREGRRGK